MVRLARSIFVGPTVGLARVCCCVRLSIRIAKASTARRAFAPASGCANRLVHRDVFRVSTLARAIVAFTALAATASLLRFGKLFHPGLYGLFYLSLPALPTLQFFGGYPLRVVVAGLTAPILRIGGFAVVPEGTCLNWAGQLIWIDAPCSGIKMLWVGMFLTFALLCLYELPIVKSALLVLLAFAVIIAANVFRAVALFYIETRVFEMPSWGHEYAGVVAFVLEAAGIVSILLMLQKRNVCGEAVSST